MDVPNKCILFNKLNVRFKRVWRIDNQEPTGVKPLGEAASKKNPVIYDAMGRGVKIMKVPGVYIVNGKKVVME